MAQYPQVVQETLVQEAQKVQVAQVILAQVAQEGLKAQVILAQVAQVILVQEGLKAQVVQAILVQADQKVLEASPRTPSPGRGDVRSGTEPPLQARGGRSARDHRTAIRALRAEPGRPNPCRPTPRTVRMRGDARRHTFNQEERAAATTRFPPPAVRGRTATRSVPRADRSWELRDAC